MHYLMIYDYAPSFMERRAEFRVEHLKLAWEAHERGELVLGGAFADPIDSGALLFKCDSAEIPERFAKSDPYVANGLVSRWRVRLWTTVVGKDASTPVRLDR